MILCHRNTWFGRKKKKEGWKSRQESLCVFKKNRLILFKGIPLFSLRYFKKKIEGVSLVWN